MRPVMFLPSTPPAGGRVIRGKGFAASLPKRNGLDGTTNRQVNTSSTLAPDPSQLQPAWSRRENKEFPQRLRRKKSFVKRWTEFCPQSRDRGKTYNAWPQGADVVHKRRSILVVGDTRYTFPALGIPATQEFRLRREEEVGNFGHVISKSVDVSESRCVPLASTLAAWKLATLATLASLHHLPD